MFPTYPPVCKWLLELSDTLPFLTVNYATQQQLFVKQSHQKSLSCRQISNCLRQLIQRNRSSVLLCLKMPSRPCCSSHTELFSGGWDGRRFLYFPLCLLVCFSIAVSQLLCLAFIGFKHMPLRQIQKHSGSVGVHARQAKDTTERFRTRVHQSSHTQKK